MKATVHRKAHFNAAHRLFIKEWTDEKNFEVFGKCSNPHYHGHNYDLTVSVCGDVDPKTGFVINLKRLKDVIYEDVELPFDHKNLNIEVPEFKDRNPTAENIAIVIWNKLREKLRDDLELTVTLYESQRNFVTYRGE
ncbi:6-pyruvoyl trahydropterin synthase family protein [Zunongwangia sp.]|uniref:6-pyruvoyl trahydropterin synthase family protein n=1 Tax=Zunongwangia sp. TaxID=1965325 RepID=UPI003AA9318F